MKEKTGPLIWGAMCFISLIWGSSFILIKQGLVAYSPIQVAAIRTLFAGLVLLPFGWKGVKKMHKRDVFFILFIAIVGSGIPAFLYALAETQVSSGLAAILNALVPTNTFLFGLLLFGTVFQWNKLIGLLVGLAGAFYLIWITNNLEGATVSSFAFLIIAATICYGINVNMVKKYCQHIPPVTLSMTSFVIVMPVAAIILLSTDFMTRVETPEGQTALFYLFLLGSFGTALAICIFYWITQKTNAFFASNVTYLIPIVAVGWSVYAGELIVWQHLIGLTCILGGVFLASK